jgi:CheY-like chemotaxis protein
MTNVRLLVVDDHADTLHLFETYLSLEGFSVVAMNNARDALRAASSGVDVIATDWAMPVMDGAQFIRSIRRSGAGRPIPIVVVTGQADARAESTLFELGACRVLHKPCDLSALADLVRWLATTCLHDCDACPNRRAPGPDGEAGASAGREDEHPDEAVES